MRPLLRLALYLYVFLLLRVRRLGRQEAPALREYVQHSTCQHARMYRLEVAAWLHVRRAMLVVQRA